MKKIILFILVIIIAVFLGLNLKETSGYVLINYNNLVIELSVWTGIIILFLSFFIGHKVINLLYTLKFLPEKTSAWLIRRRNKRDLNKTSQGLLRLAEGDYKHAMTLLSSSAKHHKKPLVNYLAAAKAAQEYGDINKRDEFLRKAYDCSPSSGLSIGLMQSNLQLANNEYEAALATLTNLENRYGVNSLVLKQQVNCFYNLKDWNKIVNLIPELVRYKVFTQSELDKKEIEAALNYFEVDSRAGNSLDLLTEVNKISSFYNYDLSKKTRLHPRVAFAYVNAVLRLISVNDIRSSINKSSQDYIDLIDNLIYVLEKSIKMNLNTHDDRIEHDINNLFSLYPEIAYTSQHFSQLEKYVKNNECNINLLYCLGKLAKKIEDYDKAYQYFNQAIKVNTGLVFDKKIELNYHMAYVLLKLGRKADCLNLISDI